ncbi:MAG TPA: queuosine precursor transporter, partial [Kofleriaceae bacterium]|nr:queuosine precursor transporter [Kofleriaceae bacterium]
MKLDARLMLFMTLVATFLTCLLVGNLIGGKITHVVLFGHDWWISAGEIPFPLTFILTDIINEFYGRKVARRVTLLGAGAIGLAVAIVQLANLAPWVPAAHGPDWAAHGNMTPFGFQNVFMSALTIELASLVAFLTANYVDISVFFVIKKLTGERFLWLRATGSTVVSQLIDTMVVIAIAFGRKLTAPQLTRIIITSYIVKVTVAVAVTPVIYALHELLEKAWHLHPLPAQVATGDVGGKPGDEQ